MSDDLTIKKLKMLFYWTTCQFIVGDSKSLAKFQVGFSANKSGNRSQILTPYLAVA